MAERGVLLQIALANVATLRDFRLFLNITTSRAANLRKGYVEGLVETYHGPVYETHEGPSPPPHEEADPVGAIAESPGIQRDEVQ